MCDSYKPDENFFDSVDCMYEHLVKEYPVLWLRDSSRIATGYISRNFLSPTGQVLAIWKGPDKGWRLRQPDERALDEVPDPNRRDFIELTHYTDTLQAFIFIT